MKNRFIRHVGLVRGSEFSTNETVKKRHLNYIFLQMSLPKIRMTIDTYKT